MLLIKISLVDYIHQLFQQFIQENKLKNIVYPRGNTMEKVISNKITRFTKKIIKPYSNRNRLMKELEIKHQSNKTIMKRKKKN